MPQTASSTPTSNVRTNILHDYANYDYNLQLWWIPISAFNKISQGSIKVGSENDILNGGQLLISNAGRSPSEASQASTFFPTDFVIDNLQFDNIVGNKGPGARGVDTLNLKFDILEPYTITLIDRLVLLAQNLQPGKDFKTLIYCLKIQFFGYDDMGKPQRIDAATKWIPFTFINMNFNITHRGATYQCQGIPMQNVALTSLDNIVPFHVELAGQKIQDLFNAEQFESKSGSARSDTVTSNAPANSNTYVIKGIADALNANEAYKVTTKAQSYANSYKFKFIGDLLNAVVLDPASIADNQRPNTSIRTADGGAQTVQQAKLGVLQQDTTSGAVRSNAGTKITDLIMSIMLTTDYMKNQVSLASTPNTSKPFNWIKIIPSIIIKQYDNTTNYFQREVTYTVKSYAYFGENHPQIDKKAVDPASLVKNYEYIYTGNNRDIIRVNLDYKVAFFDIRNASKANTADLSGDSVGTGEGSNASLAQGAAIQDTNVFKPGINNTNGDMTQANSTTVDSDKRSLSLAEMVSKLYDNGVDLITLDIEIVGDPDWIQQDNILYGPYIDDNSKTLSNGVINFQNGVTCFQFTFKTPVNDYDPVTGLMKVDNDITNTASFSGTYQVLSVTSRFNKGKFTQTLSNTRLRMQQDKTTTQRAQTNSVQTGAVVNPSFVSI